MMRPTILASLASSISFLLVKAAPAPSFEIEASTQYTVSKCVTYYGTISTASVPTTTTTNSVTFYDGTTFTKYPSTYTQTPAATTTYKTNYTTVYTTSVTYVTVPTATTTSTWVYTTTLAPVTTTAISTSYITTTSWVPTVSTIAAVSNFVPLASHIVTLKGTPNTLPPVLATPAPTPRAQFVQYFNDGDDTEGAWDLSKRDDVDPAAASYPTYVRCAALLVVDSTSTVTATTTGYYTTTAATPVVTSTWTSTASQTRTSTVQRGSTTVTYTSTSIYSWRTTSTVLTSTTSTRTSTSSYASSTHYAACGANNLVWGINSLEIPWPTNGGKWKSIFGFRSAYECCVYGIQNAWGGSIFHSYTGECQLAGVPVPGVCNPAAKTFQFYTGCPTSGSWVVSNGNCGQGTWTGKKASVESLDTSDSLLLIEASSDGSEVFNGQSEQDPIVGAFDQFPNDYPGELKA